MNRELADRLQRALTGGLHVGDESGCPMEAVIANICAAQLRAIRCAMVLGDPDDGVQEEGRGWVTTGTFTRLDAVAAIGGVMALLQDSHSIAEDVRHALKQPEATRGSERGVQ